MHAQAELFDVCGISDLVDAAVDGYNVTGRLVSGAAQDVLVAAANQTASLQWWLAAAPAGHMAQCPCRSTTYHQPADLRTLGRDSYVCVAAALPAVFAFGQTGSGKTYSIIGPSMAGMQGFEDSPTDAAAAATPTYSCSTPPADPDTPAATAPDSPASSAWSGAQHTQQPQQQPRQLSEHEGLLARCVHHLYASIGERRDSVQCSVSISCTEVYNETVTDMLAKNKNQQLPVRKS